MFTERHRPCGQSRVDGDDARRSRDVIRSRAQAFGARARLRFVVARKVTSARLRVARFIPNRVRRRRREAADAVEHVSFLAAGRVRLDAHPLLGRFVVVFIVKRLDGDASDAPRVHREHPSRAFAHVHRHRTHVRCVSLARRRKFRRRRSSGSRLHRERVDAGCLLFRIDHARAPDDGVHKIIRRVGGAIERERASDGGVGFEVLDDASRARRSSARQHDARARKRRVGDVRQDQWLRRQRRPVHARVRAHENHGIRARRSERDD